MTGRVNLLSVLLCILLSNLGVNSLADGIPPTPKLKPSSPEAIPTQEDLAMAANALRGHVDSPILSNLVQVDLRVVDEYLRARLLRGIEGKDEQTYEALVAIVTNANMTPTAKPYLEAALRSGDPVLKMIGLSGMVRVDPQDALQHAQSALSASQECMRCEGISALVSLRGSAALPRLKLLAEPTGAFERCEIAAARVRLGDTSAIPALHTAYRDLYRSGAAGAPNPHEFPWADLRKTYYRIVLESVGIGTTDEAQPDTFNPYWLEEELERFAPAIQLIGEPYGYLRPFLTDCLQDKLPVVRSQVLRCLGRVPETWANELLRSRLQDEAACTLNRAGYGWHASVACLAAICLLERGDTVGIDVLRGWVARHRELIESGKLFPDINLESCDANEDANEYAILRDSAPAVALSRAGYGEVADVLEFSVVESLKLGNAAEWESSPAWKSYHLARLGRAEGLNALRALLTMPSDQWYSRFAVESAGCIADLSMKGDSDAPLIFPPIRAWTGPLFYPDCWRRAQTPGEGPPQG